MSTVREIMDALEQKLQVAFDDALGDERIRVTVTGRLEPFPTPPAVDIYPSDPFHGTDSASFGDNGEINLTIRARVSTADSEAGQDFLLALMDDQDPDGLSVTEALQADQTLGGLASSVYVTGPSGFTQYIENTAPVRNIDAGQPGWLLGCEWKASIIPTPAVVS